MAEAAGQVRDLGILNRFCNFHLDKSINSPTATLALALCYN